MSESKLDKIDNKIDKLQDKLASIDATLAAQHESLRIHIKRTDLLEMKMEPLERHVISMKSLGRLLVYLSLAATIVECLFKMVGK